MTLTKAQKERLRLLSARLELDEKTVRHALLVAALEALQDEERFEWPLHLAPVSEISAR